MGLLVASTFVISAYPYYCSKSERKITFDQFQEALKLLAETKYPGDPKGFEKITTKLTSSKSGPVTAGATVREGACVCVCVPCVSVPMVSVYVIDLTLYWC